MSEDNKPKTTFVEEKSTQNPDKYKTITTGVRQAEQSEQSPVDTEALRQEMREEVGTSTTGLTEDLASAISNPHSKAVKYGIIGSGHGGSRLAEQFYQFGYRVCVANTSHQDLHHINLPAENKCYMEFALGGAGKDMDIGGAATEENEQALKNMFELTFGPDLQQIDALILAIGGGGGCISEDANVFTTFSGLESFKSLYEKIKNRNDRFIEPTENGELIDIRDLNVETFSLNKQGNFEKDQVLEISKHNVPKERVYTIRTKDGAEVTTSDTHPFIVLDCDQIYACSAEALRPGDLLFKPEIEWPFKDNQKINGMEITPEIAWLTGLILGDGSFVKTKTGQSLRIYTDCEFTAKKAVEIINRTFKTSSKYEWKPKRNFFQVTCNYKAPVAKLLEICECNYGSKTYTLDVPESITKSSRESVIAFIAGFIDADGWVTDKYATMGSVSKKFISKIASILQLLGYKATFTEEDPNSWPIDRNTSNWENFFKVRLSNNLYKFNQEVSKYLTNKKRKSRLDNFQSQIPRISIPVDRDFLIENLKNVGLNFQIKDRKIGSVSLHDLVNKRTTKVTLEKLLRLKKLVEDTGTRGESFNKLVSFLNNVEKVVEVVEVENSKKDCEFYDFTVKNNNNYLSGENGLTVVHNTGSGSSIPLIQMLSDYGLPITVLYTLPTASEGTITKSNAITTLDKLAQLSVNKLINGLVIIDNSRIENLYSNISLGGFYKVANFDIANIFNTFNTLSSLPTQYTAIDPMDFTRIMTSGNCTIYGKIEIPLFAENGIVDLEEDDIADLLLQNLQEGLLAEGFNVSEAIRAGVYVTGQSKHLTQIPAAHFNYAFASLNEELRSADLFSGVYADERLEDKLVIYTLISGVGLPKERVEALKFQAAQDVEEMEEKEIDSKAKMEVFQKTIETDQDRYRKKKKQNSTFGRMVRRRRGRN